MQKKTCNGFLKRGLKLIPTFGVLQKWIALVSIFEPSRLQICQWLSKSTFFTCLIDSIAVSTYIKQRTLLIILILTVFFQMKQYIYKELAKNLTIRMRLAEIIAILFHNKSQRLQYCLCLCFLKMNSSSFQISLQSAPQRKFPKICSSKNSS